MPTPLETIMAVASRCSGNPVTEENIMEYCVITSSTSCGWACKHCGRKMFVPHKTDLIRAVRYLQDHEGE